jgi:Domain of unknown function (DUF4401)
MMDLASFCRAFELGEASARRVLAGERHAAGPHMPWYVQLILGIGGWITALAMIAFILAFMALVLDVEEPGLPAAAFGAAMFGLGLVMLLRKGAGVFVHQFAAALAAAGSVLAAGGIGFETESLWSAATVAVLCCLLTIWRAHDAVLQFLTAALAAGLSVGGLIDVGVPHRIDIVALCAPLGFWLYLTPPRLDMRPAATVLLLAMPLLAAFDGTPLLPTTAGGWLARAIHLGLLLALLGPLGRRAEQPQDRLALAIFGAVAGAVCLLLPAGGSAALLLMMLAFVLGSRPLALVGMVLQIYFIWRFYYDLEASLLDKSLILIGVGLLLLAAYGVLARRPTTRPS